jgi:hypothetical protein
MQRELVFVTKRAKNRIKTKNTITTTPAAYRQEFEY